MGRRIIGGLLGAAAGLAFVPAAQAADLPVKAKPVEYVKVCSAYGAGFYYIPGTDICLRVGGAVRADYYHHAIGAFPHISNTNPGAGGTYNRDEESHGFRGRGYWILDARQNTAYGTLRAFLNGYVSWTTAPAIADAINADRAFIQFAGFTFGRAASFYDFYGSTGAYANLVTWNGQTTGATGWNVLAYTAQFGNGVSATISLEDQRRKSVAFLDAGPNSASTIITGSAGGCAAAGGVPGGAASAGIFCDIPAGVFGTNGAFTVGGPAVSRRAGQDVPAIVGALRVDQSWGSAQIMGAVQEVRGTYLGVAPAAGAGTNAFPQPEDKWGYAFGGGFTWNNPSAPGSVFGIQASWAKGATGYVAHSYSNHSIYDGSSNASVGWLTDAVFAPVGYAGSSYNGSLQLTTAWGFNAGYQHRFNPNWAVTVHGGYTKIDHNGTATALICAAGSSQLTGGSAAFPVGSANCNPDFSFWSLGSRLNWTPVAGLNIGLDVMYHSFDSAFEGLARLPQTGTRERGVYALGDQDVWSAMFRVQRDF